MRLLSKRLSGSVAITLLLAACSLQAQPLPMLVDVLRQCGVEKVILSEEHAQEENLGLLNDVLEGGCRRGKVAVYRELWDWPREHLDNEQMLAALQTRAKALAWIARTGYALKELSGPDWVARPDYVRFTRIGSARQVSFHPLYFHIAARDDMSAFLQHKGFAVGAMGVAHAEHEPRANFQSFVPWTKATLPFPIDQFTNEDRTHSKQSFRRMTGALKKAIDAGRSVAVVRSGRTFGTENEAQAWIDYYVRERNMTVVRLGTNLIAAPCSCQEAVLRLVRPVGGRPQDWLPAWVSGPAAGICEMDSTPAQVKDEL